MLERLLADPSFGAALAADPVRALAGYHLSTAEVALLHNQLSGDTGGQSAVEARANQSSVFGLLTPLTGMAALGEAAGSLGEAGPAQGFGSAQGPGPAQGLGPARELGPVQGLGSAEDRGGGAVLDRQAPPESRGAAIAEIAGLLPAPGSSADGDETPPPPAAGGTIGHNLRVPEQP